MSSVAQAVHVHANESKLPSHECSICSVAHAGVILSVAYNPSPTFVRTELVLAAEAPHLSLGFVSSLRIRPPPAV